MVGFFAYFGTSAHEISVKQSQIELLADCSARSWPEYHREQMLQARARGELIEKRLVELQASFLIVAMRRQSAGYPAGVSQPAGDGRRPHGGQGDP